MASINCIFYIYEPGEVAAKGGTYQQIDTKNIRQTQFARVLKNETLPPTNEAGWRWIRLSLAYLIEDPNYSTKKDR